ncbi:hypothetical protein FHR92_002050 [Fontibacillus solani]|uniref:Uncharacterized protein n=1 Tax=Fontibacillus solani TaxID=1572857 RepID=A0A7W3ST74_9BACL|nr:hypothetical protein [Fontibacillus solani]
MKIDLNPYVDEAGEPITSASWLWLRQSCHKKTR